MQMSKLVITVISNDDMAPEIEGRLEQIANPSGLHELHQAQVEGMGRVCLVMAEINGEIVALYGDSSLEFYTHK